MGFTTDLSNKGGSSSVPQDRRYLYRLGNRWYARIPVPYKLRGQRLNDGRKLGPYYQRALGTADIRVAQRRRWDVQREAHELFDKLLSPGKREADDYRSWRENLKEADAPLKLPVEYDGIEGFETWNPGLENLLDKARELPADHPAHSAIRDHLADLKPVSELLTDYLEHNPKRSPTTAANYNAVVQRWIDVHGDKALSPKWVNRRVAASWFEKATKGKARDTAKRYATVMGHLWEWQYRLHDDLPPSPFEKLLKTAGRPSNQEADSYEAFSGDELVRIMKALKDDADLYPVALVSLYSGLRLAEVLAAEQETINGVDCWKVKKGKTKAAARLVPVHPVLADVKIATKLNSKALSVRFGRIKKRLGFPPSKTFHSLRKNFSTKLEQAGCPEGVAVRLLGHRPISMSYSVYSAGRDVVELAHWVNQVKYESL
jgi:integrase